MEQKVEMEWNKEHQEQIDLVNIKWKMLVNEQRPKEAVHHLADAN